MATGHCLESNILGRFFYLKLSLNKYFVVNYRSVNNVVDI